MKYRMTKRKIILASQSPRRKFLLEEMGLKFETRPSDFEEYFDQDRSVYDVVKELGLGKALAISKSNPDAIVIGGDLIIVLDGKQLGKPESEQEAKQMLKNFSGRSHKLICSVAVVCLAEGYQKVDYDEAEVTFDNLDKRFIDAYVATGTTYDKAGGYAIQHPMIKPYIKDISGRLDTIIGLPTQLVADFLADFGIKTESLNINSQTDLKKSGFFD